MGKNLCAPPSSPVGKAVRYIYSQYARPLSVDEVAKASGITSSALCRAFKCGFQSLSNFNRQFQKVKGMSPTNYISGLQQ
ncbi:AraC family transcriptional regulator [uncultured Parabacteroides sp.]|jgi:AraC-like DNA-binding protein|uniref:AraC family transcriptional regulator n=1 Tax=uncultured Parabacteroides sp. TaxID=512312 RepID=UPI0025EFFCA1|nr:AraC family transcriptional regulator [uncultured Parabacteroides sp.]